MITSEDIYMGLDSIHYNKPNSKVSLNFNPIPKSRQVCDSCGNTTFDTYLLPIANTSRYYERCSKKYYIQVEAMCLTCSKIIHLPVTKEYIEMYVFQVHSLKAEVKAKNEYNKKMKKERRQSQIRNEKNERRRRNESGGIKVI